MINRIRRHPTTRQLFLYGVIGLAAAVVDLSMFSAFNYFTSNTHAVMANILGSFAGFLISFYGNAFLNFKKKDYLLKRFFTYLLICTFGTILSSSIIYLLQYSINLTLLKIFCMGFVAAVQFVLNKFITFRDILPIVSP